MLKKNNNLLLLFLGIGFFLIPFGDMRIFPSIPLYIYDILFIVLGLFLLYFFSFQNIDFKIKTHSLILWVSLLVLLISAGISWYVNEPSLSGLGKLKSWLILPSLSLLGFSLFSRKIINRDQKILSMWLLGIASLVVYSIPYFIFEIFTYDGRFEGPFTSPNFLGFFLFPGVVLSLYFFSQHRNFKKIPFLFLVSTILFLLFKTESFGSWLAVIVSSSYFFIQNQWSKKRQASLLSVVLVVGIFFGITLFQSEKFNQIFTERSSLSSRVMIWEVSLQAIQDNPVRGIGMGRFQEVYLSYQPYYPPFLEWAVPQPHNFLFALILQLGLLGTFAFLTLTFFALKEIFQKAPPERRVLESILLGMIVYGIFDTPLFGNALAFLWWLPFSLLLYPEDN